MNLIRKIAVVGPESSGKTTLTRNIANRLEEPWVPEFARKFLTDLDRPYDETDLVEIARGQVASEEEAKNRSAKCIVCDTDHVVIRIWSIIKYGVIASDLQEILDAQQPADLYILTDPNIPWEYDPLRENPFDRDFLFEQYFRYLKERRYRFRIVSGSQEERLSQALEEVKTLGW